MMQKWAAVTCLNLVKADTTSAMEIQFVSGEYGTGFAFTADQVALSYPPYPGLSDPGQGGDIDLNNNQVFTDGCTGAASESIAIASYHIQKRRVRITEFTYILLNL